MRETKPQIFSRQLESWLKSDNDKSLTGLIQAFGEKAFAIIFLILMALPALPIPTGGVTHVTELLTAIGAVQLIAGRRTLWLPQWATRKVNVGKMMSGKAGHKLIGVIKWFERWSRRRLAGLLVVQPVLSAIGLFILIFTVAAFAAPPFSGLDTLPALGVVVISLALILEDSLLVVLGIIIGCVGIGVEIATGEALYHSFTHFF